MPNAITFSYKTKNELVFRNALNRIGRHEEVVMVQYTEEERLKSFIRFLSTIAVHCFMVRDFKGGRSFLKKALSYKKFIFNSVFLNVINKTFFFVKKPLNILSE